MSSSTLAQSSALGLIARQCSVRGGILECELLDDRVTIGGSTVRYLDGEIYV